MKNGRYSAQAVLAVGLRAPDDEAGPERDDEDEHPGPASHHALLRQPPPHDEDHQRDDRQEGATFSTGRTLRRSLWVHDA